MLGQNSLLPAPIISPTRRKILAYHAHYHEKVRHKAATREFWWSLLAALIAAGILSRLTHSGFILIDKYLGDALYAAMVFTLLRLTDRFQHPTFWAALIMLAIELFQLTGLPAEMLGSQSTALQVCARLLGTQFSPLDLLAYSAGIVCVSVLSALRNPPQIP